jgi:hypothetical protein
MRLSEFNLKALDADIIEDDTEDRGDDNLVTALTFLRNKSRDQHLNPKVRVDSLINMVKNTGADLFNLDSLTQAFKQNQSVKNLIKDIKDDEQGVKYVFLKTFSDDDVEEETAIAYGTQQDNPDKVVSQMADRALKND